MAPIYCARLGQLMQDEEQKLSPVPFFPTGGNGNWAGVVSSFFLLQVLRQTQLRGKSD